MIVSAHQPNFAPWLGFFDKAWHSDVLVLLDTVQFIKRGYQNRARIKASNGPQWLTVPVVTKGRYDQPTHDVEIDETARWRSVHLRTLHTALAKAPHRDEVLDLVEPIYGRDDVHHLVDLNVALIRAVAARLGPAHPAGAGVGAEGVRQLDAVDAEPDQSGGRRCVPVRADRP